jgi:acetate kinase
LKPPNSRILTINGGWSSIKFALFDAGDALQRLMEGAIERIGLQGAAFAVKALDPADCFSHAVTVPDHTAAVTTLMDWIEERSEHDRQTGVARSRSRLKWSNRTCMHKS